MAKLFFSLRDVPADEANDVRQLLTEHQIEYYETSAGHWGFSTHAIWLNNNDDFPTAAQLLTDYQRQRYQQQHEIYQREKQAGTHKKFFDVVRQQPLQLLLYFGFSAFILYISVKLVAAFGR